MWDCQIIEGDCLAVLPTLAPQSVQCCVTSPPYWGLRDYGVNGQLGLESTPEEYIANMVGVFREVWRVLRDDGVLWLNLGDSYTVGTNADRMPTSTTGPNVPAGWSNRNQTIRRKTPGLKPKDLVGIPWRVAFALQADGWYLRSDIIWHKPNPMPESVTDRPTRSHEYIFLLSKNERYFYDTEAIREDAISNHSAAAFRGGSYVNNSTFDNTQGRLRTMHGDKPGNGFRNKRSVWTIATQAYSEAHFATFPEEIPKLCILAGSRLGDIILDPFAGSGTVGQVALELGRGAILIELNPDYIDMARGRTDVTPGMF